MTDWKIRLRLFILRIFRPITIWIGSIHLPYTIKKFKGKHITEVKAVIKPGSVFLTKTNGELSNWAIPGFWSHAAMYIGNDQVIEAVGKHGVRITDIYSFLLTKDYVAVMHPEFCDDEAMATAVGWALGHLGKGYDFLVGPASDVFYCSELIFKAYKFSIDGVIPFTSRKTLGVWTVTPDDIFLAKRKWECVWTNYEEQS